MRHYLKLFIVLINFIYCASPTENDVSYGYIDPEWIYKNPELAISFPLPKDWYFLNANTETLVKIGSDINNIKAYTIPLNVPIQEFRKSNSDQIATLFAISKTDGSTTSISKEFDYNADKSILFGLVYSSNSDAYSFLRKTCLKCSDDDFKKIYLKDVKLGNTTFEGYLTGVTDNNNNKMGHFFGVRRIGDLYLVCQYNFPDLNSFETYKGYFKELSIK